MKVCLIAVSVTSQISVIENTPTDAGTSDTFELKDESGSVVHWTSS